MAPATKSNVNIPVSRLFLHLSNPRHKPVQAEAKAIERLCEKEYVLPLARDIAKNGLNPLEKFALVPLEQGKAGAANTNYYVAEGNRRICAIKLLNDPELAPANLRKSFEKLSLTWNPIESVSAAIFDDVEEVDLWIDRIHSGLQGGIGRKDWDAEQKARFDGDNKNKAAQALLDYAEREQMITPDEREGKITTVQRFISNDVFRELLGIDKSVPDELTRNRPKPEFDVLVKKFMRDLVERKVVHSRMNGPDIIEYARPMNSMAGVTVNRVQAESVSAEAKPQPRKSGGKHAKPPEKARHIQYESEIATALKNYGNEKLISLYYSITSIDLDPHTPIVSVGVWSFFETLTTCTGKKDGVSMDSYLNKNKLQNYGVQGDTVTYRSALERIRAYGNTTKHHRISATFNGDQLNNDINALKDIILKCIEDAAKQVP